GRARSLAAARGGLVMGELLIGTADWSYPDWKGVVYPRSVPEAFDPLRYLAAYLDLIEINSTFYRAPDPRHAERWAETVLDLERFRFTAKVAKEFTHTDPEAWSGQNVARFKEGIAPLIDAGKLAALVIQFPFYFDATPKRLEHLRRLKGAFDVAPLVLEVRHRSFLAPPVWKVLEELQLSFCNTDQPLSQTSIEPGARVSGPIGYLRLHGRNREAWFRKGAGRDEKYDYLYDGGELKSFASLVRELRQKTGQTFVVTNNHFLGKAPANALELKGLLEGLPVAVPETLLETYPRLKVLQERTTP
ncbi:MAG: DUF72 domain-containing protein, partial [Planctomycetota bacterium]